MRLESQFWLYFWAIIIFLFLSITLIAIKYSNVHFETIVVKEKTIDIHKEDASYLIYTQSEVYKVADMFWIGLFNCSDVYNQLEVGKTYKVKVSGRRIPFFSMYQQIQSVQPLE